MNPETRSNFQTPNQGELLLCERDAAVDHGASAALVLQEVSGGGRHGVPGATLVPRVE